MSELGDFLRHRRGRRRPGDVGLPSGARRRVPGLRREEVAILAGLSVDYYTRLEQGREEHPSAQVLGALASTLQLDDDARLHLFRLAGLAPAPAGLPGSQTAVDPRLLQLMDSWSDQPALVLDGAYDVLAHNDLGRALFGWLGRTNLMELVFLEPRAREFYVEWQRVARDSVAALRLNQGADPEHPRIREVVRRLREESPEFATLWARHDARGKDAETKALHHPQVGLLTLDVQSFAVGGARGQELAVYFAAPDSPSAQALSLLGALSATPDDAGADATS